MYKQLTGEQRYGIYVLLQEGKGKKEIATAIGVHYSTIYRELKRNRGKRDGYHWKSANEFCQERKERYPGNHAVKESIRKEALSLLSKEQWSPKQISGHLALKDIGISHETIYKLIRKDKQEGGDLYKHCRHRLKHRKRPVGQCVNIPNRTSIHERPMEADGSRFGDFEMDTIIGKDGVGAIVTLTERSTNILLMEKLDKGKNAQELAKVVVRLLMPYRKELQSITTDNGSEFVCHELITKKLGVKVYFADPYASWQKGAIENANKLVRQYIPKGTVFSELSDQTIKDIQYKINRRPRVKLNFKSPKEVFFDALY